MPAEHQVHGSARTSSGSRPASTGTSSSVRPMRRSCTMASWYTTIPPSSCPRSIGRSPPTGPTPPQAHSGCRITATPCATATSDTAPWAMTIGGDPTAVLTPRDPAPPPGTPPGGGKGGPRVGDGHGPMAVSHRRFARESRRRPAWLHAPDGRRRRSSPRYWPRTRPARTPHAAWLVAAAITAQVLRPHPVAGGGEAGHLPSPAIPALRQPCSKRTSCRSDRPASTT